MLNFYFGEEDFLIQQAIKKTKEDFIQKNPQALVEFFDGEENSANEFLTAISQGGGLFSSVKLVVLRDVFNFDKVDQEAILDFFKKNLNTLVDVQILISWNGKLKSDKLFIFFKKNSEVKEFKKINNLDLEKFVINKLQQTKLKINQNTLRKIVFMLGDDLWLLDRELEKLINLKLEGEIIEKDLNNIGGVKINAKIFDLIDAIGNKNKPRALELLNFLLDKGDNAFHILSMIVFQIRNLALIFDCKGKGIFDPNIISQKTALHPFMAKKTFAQSRLFSSQQVKKIYKRIFSLDINAKSGRIKIEEGLQDFIVKI
jgi:DNA polymerase-3 subunit delta